MKEEVIYSLNIADIQAVAKEILDRELAENELTEVKELVPKKIKWFDAIEAAIWERKNNQ